LLSILRCGLPDIAVKEFVQFGPIDPYQGCSADERGMEAHPKN